MSTNVPNWFVQSFSTNIVQLSQQKQSRLRQAVMTGSHQGEQASPVDQVGLIAMQDVVSRFGPMGRVDATVDRRWVFPNASDLPQLIDTFDRLKLITDPSSIFVTNAVSAANRKYDDLILGSMFVNAATGKNGGTSTPFDTANQVVGVNVGGANSGMNVAKLRAGRKQLMANEVDLDSDTIYCAITSNEHDALLNEIQIVSTDFNDKPVLVGGKITSFLGVNFIHSERPVLTTTAVDDQAGNSRAIPMWAKSGVYLGVWNDIETSISKRNDLQGEPWQAYVKLVAGATRLEEKKVIKIWCH